MIEVLHFFIPKYNKLNKRYSSYIQWPFLCTPERWYNNLIMAWYNRKVVYMDGKATITIMANVGSKRKTKNIPFICSFDRSSFRLLLASIVSFGLFLLFEFLPLFCFVVSHSFRQMCRRILFASKHRWKATHILMTDLSLWISQNTKGHKGRKRQQQQIWIRCRCI